MIPEKSKRDKRRNILYLLEHADRQIVGNFLFSEWRYYTHWALPGEYDPYMLKFHRIWLTSICVNGVKNGSDLQNKPNQAIKPIMAKMRFLHS